jgi:UDP-GlcNAc:undecaprenyl-phosphate GlcNAc-1-phosphate transferase
VQERILLTGILAAAVTALAIFMLRSQAGRFGLLDRPGGHKLHHGAVPVIGGIAMFLGFIAAMSALPGSLSAYPAFVSGCALLVAMGAYDDARRLTPRVRLLGHVLVAVLVFHYSPHRIRLESLGDFLGLGPVSLGVLALPVTVFVMVAAINAFNMLDGLDGLAGGVALAAGLLLLTVGDALQPGLVPLLSSLVGATAAFLCFNAPTMLNRPVRTFMGDAGSTLIGFTLATVLIGSCQGEGAVFTPVNSVWFLFLPATEVIHSTFRRILSGRSPFAPDRGHLHHQLRAAGWSVRGIFVFVTAVTLLAGNLGLWLQRAAVPEWVSFGLLLGTSAGLMLVVRLLVARARAHTLHEETHSVLADAVGDVPHVSGVEGLDRGDFVRQRPAMTVIDGVDRPVRVRFVTPEQGPPDVESPSSDIDVA